MSLTIADRLNALVRFASSFLVEEVEDIERLA